MIKYILLDIDGVMVPEYEWKLTEELEDGFYEFCSKAVNSLENIIKNIEAHILLITSHKNKFTSKEWLDIFKKRGINTEKLSILYPDLGKLQSILKFSKENINYVVIDDSNLLNQLPSNIKERWIKPQKHIGLTLEEAQLAIEILNATN